MAISFNHALSEKSKEIRICGMRSTTASTIVVSLICVCLQSQVSAASSAPQPSSILSYIADGIRHGRQSLPNVAVKVTYQGDNLLSTRVASSEPRPQQTVRLDSPNTSTAEIYWIAQDGNLSFDVHMLGNLAADQGDKTWYGIEQRLVLCDGQLTSADLYRKRLPMNSGKFTEKLAWSGRVNVGQDALVDGMWSEQYHLDPRYVMYFVDDEPFDEAMQEPSNSTREVGEEDVYGSKCVEVELTRPLPDGSVYVVDCWVDTDHDFVIRKSRILTKYPKNPQKPDFLFAAADTLTLLHVGTNWMPASYSKQTNIPGKTAQGKDQVTTIHEQITMDSVPATYPWISNPFTIKWPEGTYVNDIPGNKRYLAQADGTLKLVAN